MDKKKLIEYLLDEKIDDATRDDCAIALSEFIYDEVVAALISVANNLKDVEMVRASCGESLAEIWIKKNEINYDVLNNLGEPARSEALGLLRQDKPEWYLEYEKLY